MAQEKFRRLKTKEILKAQKVQDSVPRGSKLRSSIEFNFKFLESWAQNSNVSSAFNFKNSKKKLN